MFLHRALVTLVLGPLALYLIYLGGWYYFLPVALILLLATYEYVHLMERLGWRPAAWLLLPAVLGQLVAGQWPAQELAAPFMALGLLAMLVYALWSYERGYGSAVPAAWLAMMAGLLYIGWMGGHFFRLRNLETMAWQWTMLALGITWLADSAAYVVGKRWGRRKLSPRLSPNKTVEGYVGGILVGVLAAALVAVWLDLPLGPAVGVGLLVSTLGTAGDLGISLLKRTAGVKDSGSFLPGHGGALDRVDSLLWSVVVAYYTITLFVV